MLRIVDPAIRDAAEPPARAGHRYVTIEAAVERIGERNPFNGDFGGSFLLRTSPGGDHEPGVLHVSLTFEVPEDATIDWLKYNPNLFFGSLYFDRASASTDR